MRVSKYSCRKGDDRLGERADQFLRSALQGEGANLRSFERLPFPSIISAKGI